MTTKKLVIVGAVLVGAVLVWWFAFRKKAVSVVGYAPVGVAPSPGAAITTLLATPPATLANAAITTGLNYLLPVVGAGVSTTKAETFVPGNSDPGDCTSAWAANPSYAGPAPKDPRIWCAARSSTPSHFGSIAGVLAQLQAQGRV